MSGVDFALPPPPSQTAAAGVRLLALDVDGTLTDGRLTFSAAGDELKTFDVHDGMGLHLLRDAGIIVAWITARSSEVVRRRADELGIGDLLQGSRDKAAGLREVCARHAVALDAAAFMGDDLPDLPAMAIAGLAIAPANAHPWVKAHCGWITLASGGRGAVREVCDALLGCQGKAGGSLARYVGS